MSDTTTTAAKPTQEQAAAMIAETTQALALIHPDPAEVFEIRVLGIPGRGKPHTASGYFDGQHLDAAARLALKYSESHKATGVYLTLNPCNSALLARSPYKITDYLDTTTTDKEILRRRWLFIDIDPKRPSNIAANDAEVQAAADTADEIVDKLRGYGFPYPLCGFSGNGRYLFYPIDLPNTDAETQLLKAFYAGLATLLPQFIDPNKPYADIDRSVYNAARIARVGGTLNRKGCHTADRPHRRAEMFDPGEPVEVVPAERIGAVAALAPAKAATSTTSTASKNGKAPSGKIDVPVYCAAYGMKIREAKQEGGRTIYILEACPFDSNHGPKGDTCIIQAESGLTTFHCKHDSCQGHTWADFKERVGKLESQHMVGGAAGQQLGECCLYSPLADGRHQIVHRGRIIVRNTLAEAIEAAKGGTAG